MKEVVIVAARRSPIGSFGGSLKNLSAVELGQKVVEKTLADINLDPNLVDEVILGNVLSAGLGQNVARQVALKSGLPQSSSALTINKVCGSGLKAVILAAQSIMLEENDIVIAGGTESMSQAAYVLPNHRWGGRMGNGEIVDTLLKDGLTDAFDGIHMGITAENIAEKFGFTREAQDAFAASSQNKAEAAITSGRFTDEIVEIEIPVRKGEPIKFNQDEFPRFGSTADGLGKLRAAFKKDGTVTAGNASGVNDGAAILVLMSRDKAEELGMEIMGSIASYATAGVDPTIMGTGPIPSTKRALTRAGLEVSDLDLVEANEAFAAQAMSVVQELGLDEAITNVNGGAVALGHPIGASGARVLVTLLHEMKKREAKNGLATLCIGGGQGISLIIKRDE
ncbi:acetyl-CoA C-acetyltransferase [Vagococcus xieshaowenii]|uniref:acetyl-CoA C-acetyltransferase n=1 Tax=Vagococcus xieshaowenii TaxID=2562451 RepID=A0AAJ5EDI8_9ENTE|nr:acetyl-CoA C-acetyltransferase [Vagococcus xieshaowenii]QCA28104.1 acetyl-CoA C-acetyltransferase [Vagococcus xieshaowenii]TFZ40147.1 acetyl-CoA C-acetyltransferase [Vagococcus xieshaowenii]